ncbi:hypothetical protein OAT67_09280 [Bacteriovoracaceae bacterium]|nr:hypothetical protein [Bacteriovoracaceae bacterium]
MKSFLKFFTLFIVNSVFAQSDININLACQKKPIHIHYINGVNVSEKRDAQITASNIRTLFQKSNDITTNNGVKTLSNRFLINPLGDIKGDTVYFTHNQSAGLIDDVTKELAFQKEYIKDLNRDYLYNNYSKMFFFEPNVSKRLLRTENDVRLYEDINAKMLELLGDPENAEKYYTDIGNVVNQIKAALKDGDHGGHNVVLISHSQGNAFANILYHKIFETINSSNPSEDDLKYSSYYANLRVAPPVTPSYAQSSIGNYSVIKLAEDMIVNTGVPIFGNEQAPTYSLIQDEIFPSETSNSGGLTELYLTITDYVLWGFSTTLGHGMDDMYLNDKTFIRKLSDFQNYEAQTPADVVLEQLHELAKKFPNRCKAPLVKGDVNINVNIQKEDKISLTLQLSTEMSGVVDFRGEGVDAGALNTHKGDLTLSTISLYTKENDEYNNLPEEALTLSTNADTKTMTVLVEDIKENVPFDFFGKKILYVKVGASDLFNNYGESTEFKEIEICSGVSCCKENEIFFSNQCLPEPGPCQSYNEDTLELYYSVAPSCSVKCTIRDDNLGNPAFCNLRYENVICAQQNATYGKRIPLSGTITLVGHCKGLGEFSTTHIYPTCSCSL